MGDALGAALSYRQAVPVDAGWLADTYLASLQAAIAGVRGYWDETKEREQFLSQLRLPDTEILILGERPVGFFTAWFEVDHLFLGTLCVIPAHQSSGLGTLAMCELAKRCGNLPIRLSVLKSNVRARKFYERLGCDCTSSSQHHDHLEWPNKAMHATCEDARA
jgi:ribosomal protein S18 acetylase RimI-like enzyme